MKPKLLLISAIPPFPQTSGGATRVFHTIKELSKKYSIYFITFNSANNDFYQKYTNKFINLNLKLKSLTSKIPYRFSDWDNHQLKTLIPKIIKENDIKIIQIEFSQLLYLVKFIPKNVTTIFTAHDISGISFWRRIPESDTFTKKLASVFFWLQIWLYEKRYLPQYDQINTVSTKDQRYLKSIYKLSSTVVPNGIEKIEFLPKKPSEFLNLGFIGSFSHPPNKYAVEYFLNNIAPLLDKTKYQFLLAGNNPNINDPRIINLGIVNNVKDFYRKIDVLIAPIFSGSGTRIKILESLSFGVPVITTAIGSEGIEIKNKFLQIANNPAEFAIKTSNLPKLSNQDYDILKIQLQPYLWSNIFKN